MALMGVTQTLCAHFPHAYSMQKIHLLTSMRKIFPRKYYHRKYSCGNIPMENIPAKIFPRKIFPWKIFPRKMCARLICTREKRKQRQSVILLWWWDSHQTNCKPLVNVQIHCYSFISFACKQTFTLIVLIYQRVIT